MCVLSFTGHEGEGGSEEDFSIPSREGSEKDGPRETWQETWKRKRSQRSQVMWKSFISSRSSEQVGTIENNRYDLSILRGHSQATARAPLDSPIPQTCSRRAQLPETALLSFHALAEES